MGSPNAATKRGAVADIAETVARHPLRDWVFGLRDLRHGVEGIGFEGFGTQGLVKDNHSGWKTSYISLIQSIFYPHPTSKTF